MNQYQQNPYQPPPKKSRKGLIVLAAVGAVVVFAGIGSALGGDSDSGDKAKPTKSVKAADKPEPKDEEKSADEKPEKKAKPKAEKKPDSSTVTFKVWGNGNPEIMYGSDTDNRQGSGMPMTKTLKFSDDAMYYQVNAQLQGGGDIHCSVTVNGKTKKAHASGGYNICNAQLSNTGLGWG